MSLRSLSQKLRRLENQWAKQMKKAENPILISLRRDPAQILRLAGLIPDAWQEQQLRLPSGNRLLLASRQSGKSTLAAALALRVALLQPGAPVLLVSPSLRQSGELFRKVVELFNLLGRPVAVRAESAARLELANGARVLSLPGDESTVRGFSGVALLVIDEAARVSDAMYYAVRPMLAVSQGQLVALSTPFGQRGWFYEEWQSHGAWQRVRITADECARIKPEFLAEEQRSLGERWYQQEYQCSFEETTGAVFSNADIQAAIRSDLEPMFIG
jgi:Terminase large subunit, T4likevirus-type, N-terminal